LITPYSLRRPGRIGDTAADERQHFIMVRAKVLEQAPVPKLNLVLSWSEELERRVATGN
jgi:hypothetical protein